MNEDERERDYPTEQFIKECASIRAKLFRELKVLCKSASISRTVNDWIENHLNKRFTFKLTKIAFKKKTDFLRKKIPPII